MDQNTINTAIATMIQWLGGENNFYGIIHAQKTRVQCSTQENPSISFHFTGGQTQWNKCYIGLNVNDGTYRIFFAYFEKTQTNQHFHSGTLYHHLLGNELKAYFSRETGIVLA